MVRRGRVSMKWFGLALAVVQISVVATARAQGDAGPEDSTDIDSNSQSSMEESSAPGKGSRLLLKMKKRSVVVDKNGETRDVSERPSLLFPHWQPEELKPSVRPIIGLRFYKDSVSSESVFQGELGALAEVRGIPLVAGNPGVQLSPQFGYAAGRAGVLKSGFDADWGGYERIWGGAAVPVYYKSLKQTFVYRYGVLKGGPLPEVHRSVFQSDSGVAIIPHVSAHYTLTIERSESQRNATPKDTIESYDHWLTGRFSTKALNFYVHAGPGYTTTTLGTEGSSATLSRSETYVLARTGADIIPSFGLDGEAKYVFSSEADTAFRDPAVRSPFEDLGAASTQQSYPEDSLHASVFFGFKKLFAGFGVGWTYSLKILNMSERDGRQRERTSSNGLGIVGQFSF
jgi:hypothetical protein